MNPDDMVPNKRYRILHKSEAQRYSRMSVMTYLGRGGASGDELQFNARPVAGTQALPDEWIYAIEEVPPDTPVTLNKRAP
jgi:hypothetical protein